MRPPGSSRDAPRRVSRPRSGACVPSPCRQVLAPVTPAPVPRRSTPPAAAPARNCRHRDSHTGTAPYPASAPAPAPAPASASASASASAPASASASASASTPVGKSWLPSRPHPSRADPRTPPQHQPGIADTDIDTANDPGPGPGPGTPVETSVDVGPSDRRPRKDDPHPPGRDAGRTRVPPSPRAAGPACRQKVARALTLICCTRAFAHASKLDPEAGTKIDSSEPGG